MLYFYLNNCFAEIKTNNANAMYGMLQNGVYVLCELNKYSKGIFVNNFLKIKIGCSILDLWLQIHIHYNSFVANYLHNCIFISFFLMFSLLRYSLHYVNIYPS